MDPELTQVCINTSESIVGLVAMVVAGATAVTNFVKSPDQYTNPVMKVISRIFHFVSGDIVTAVKKPAA